MTITRTTLHRDGALNTGRDSVCFVHAGWRIEVHPLPTGGWYGRWQPETISTDDWQTTPIQATAAAVLVEIGAAIREFLMYAEMQATAERIASMSEDEVQALVRARTTGARSTSTGASAPAHTGMYL
jgi:hypothetical protein